MTAPVRLPRRNATGNPPTALTPLFHELSSRRGPIALLDLEGCVGRTEISGDDLGDAVQIDTGAYVRTLVFERQFVEVLVMAWLPGQRSPIHDHAGSACIVRVVSGSAAEKVFRRRSDGLVELDGERQLSAGGLTASFDGDIHSFGNAADAPAPIRDILVTLHVYSPPLTPTRKYREA